MGVSLPDSRLHSTNKPLIHALVSLSQSNPLETHQPPPSFYETLAKDASKWRTTMDWPASSLRLCGHFGLFRGLSGVTDASSNSSTSPQATPWTSAQQIEALIQLAKADLLTTFVITQHIGAIKRIVASDPVTDQSHANSELCSTILPALLSGDQMASVGISHLTTSRLHLGRPAVIATPDDSGFRLSGTIPWVTGAPRVEQIVVGATLEDQTQTLVLLSPSAEGVSSGPGAEMIAMSASCTDAVVLDDVLIPGDRVLSGPRPNVLSQAAEKNRPGESPTGAGGLQTSALALGLSYAALDYLRSESTDRETLVPIVDRFDEEHRSLHAAIHGAASGQPGFDSAAIRSSTNGLVQRTTSAAMTTAKGAGMMIDHPVGRWCQQAFFFLVWSCPQPVAQAHLCELVGLDH